MKRRHAEAEFSNDFISKTPKSEAHNSILLESQQIDCCNTQSDLDFKCKPDAPSNNLSSNLRSLRCRQRP